MPTMRQIPSAAIYRRTQSLICDDVIIRYDTIRYDTIVEFNVDSKAEYAA